MSHSMSADQARPLPKRFYEKVTLQNSDSGWQVQLDGRIAKTPGRYPLAAMQKPLAEAIAGEWAAQRGVIDPATMPLTQRRMLVIDRGDADRTSWADGMRNYLQSDLICYRADDPAELVERQEEVWGSYQRWAKDNLSIPLKATTGIIAVSQSPMAEQGLNAQIAEMDNEILCCMAAATEITGSVILALALGYRAAKPEEIFAASRLDERYQAEKWGQDSEAMAREKQLETEFLSLSRYLDLISD